MYGDDSAGGSDCETDHSAQHQLRLRPHTGARRDLAPASRCPPGHGCDRGDELRGVTRPVSCLAFAYTNLFLPVTGARR